MSPTLEPGDEVLVDQGAYALFRPKKGDLVLAQHPFVRGMELIKRVERVQGGRVTLQGDNPGESTDSRSFGALPISHILGRVFLRLPASA